MIIEYFMIYLVLGMAVSASTAGLWIDRKDRLKVTRDLEIEVTVMRESIKQISQVHNNLTAQAADNASQIAMLTERLSILLQGINNGSR